MWYLQNADKIILGTVVIGIFLAGYAFAHSFWYMLGVLVFAGLAAFIEIAAAGGVLLAIVSGEEESYG